MLCMYSGVNQNAVCYDCKVKPDGKEDRSSWFEESKPELKSKNPFINLPYIIDHTTEGEEVIITQTNACLSYLGRKLGMWGKNNIEVAQCEQLLCELMDLRNNMVRFSYAPNKGDAENKVDAVAVVTGACSPSTGIFQKFEQHLQSAVGPFLVGGEVSAPDFHFWEMLDQYKSLAEYAGLPDPYANFPKIAMFYKGFAELPRNQAYLNSPLHRLPFNNKGARFGSCPDLKKFKQGQEYDWAEVGGIY